MNQLQSDILYSPAFESLIREFIRVVNGTISIQDIAPLLEQMKRSEILQVLMKDPEHESAKACLQNYFTAHPNLPYEFINKFLTILNVKINITPNGLGFINQSYNAKVITTNLQPSTKITNLTLESRKNQLREDIRDAQVFQYKSKPIPQTVRLKLNNNILSRCINAIGDLHNVIKDGNLANNCEIDDYIRTNVTSNC